MIQNGYLIIVYYSRRVVRYPILWVKYPVFLSHLLVEAGNPIQKAIRISNNAYKISFPWHNGLIQAIRK